MYQERLARQVLLVTPTGKWVRVDQGPIGVITSSTLLGPVLVWSHQNYLILLKAARNGIPSPRVAAPRPYQRK